MSFQEIPHFKKKLERQCHQDVSTFDPVINTKGKRNKINWNQGIVKTESGQHCVYPLFPPFLPPHPLKLIVPSQDRQLTPGNSFPASLPIATRQKVVLACRAQPSIHTEQLVLLTWQEEKPAPTSCQPQTSNSRSTKHSPRSFSSVCFFQAYLCKWASDKCFKSATVRWRKRVKYYSSPRHLKGVCF